MLDILRVYYDYGVAFYKGEAVYPAGYLSSRREARRHDVPEYLVHVCRTSRPGAEVVVHTCPAWAYAASKGMKPVWAG